jgi:hypothetical protein
MSAGSLNPSSKNFTALTLSVFDKGSSNRLEVPSRMSLRVCPALPASRHLRRIIISSLSFPKGSLILVSALSASRPLCTRHARISDISAFLPRHQYSFLSQNLRISLSFTCFVSSWFLCLLGGGIDSRGEGVWILFILPICPIEFPVWNQTVS